MLSPGHCNNPEEFAQRSNKSDSNNADFKRKREVKDMVQYLVDCYMKRFSRLQGFSAHTRFARYALLQMTLTLLLQLTF